jgi:5-methylcytosine-specific restriction enzyme subunit McrC
MQTIELTEFEAVSLPPDVLTEADARLIDAVYRSQLLVTPPSYQTNNQWKLKAQGWVGHMPLTPDLRVIVAPKVTVYNLFRMLECAYDLDVFRPKNRTQVTSLRDFYDRLAHILAERVQQRSKQGFFRAYEPRSNRLPVVRGRLDLREMARQPVGVALPCDYELFSADTPDNQIIHWTLRHIIRSGLCRPETQQRVRHAYNALSGLVTPTPFTSEACVGRTYTRLNEDYRPMHLLCRFFLANSGPAHRHGDMEIQPFLVDMAALFEKFVARWLEQHLPSQFSVTAQEHRTLDNGALTVNIDLVLRERATGHVLAVLDTKYKADNRPSPNDIYQIDSYADIAVAPTAILIYPEPLAQPLSIRNGNVHIRSAVFDLSGDLESAGRRLLTQIDLSHAVATRG